MLLNVVTSLSTIVIRECILFCIADSDTSNTCPVNGTFHLYVSNQHSDDVVLFLVITDFIWPVK